MAGYKNGKIMLPIKEFLIVKGQATYELNTIDMNKVTVFYRKYNQEAFLETYKEMPKGNYRINEVGGNKQLEITDLDILDEYYSIQLCRVVDLTSSQYNPSGEIDVITLNQHLNEVIADVTFLFTYLKDVGMVMDSSAGNKILAELKPNTTWFMDENGNMAAMPVNSLFEGFNQLVETLRQQILTLLTQDYSKLSQDLKDETTSLLKSLSDKFDKLVTDSKEILDTYTQGKIQEIKLACDRLLLISEYKVWKANAIEDLKTMDFLQVGDVVEVLGYYSAGDGAGHQRIIASEDDGSGVQLGNGLWANIVHNGEVNVSWFGAKGDGVSDNGVIINDFISKQIRYLDNNERINIVNKDESLTLIFPQGEFLTSKTIYLPRGVKLIGNGSQTFGSSKNIKRNGVTTIHYTGNTKAISSVIYKDDVVYEGTELLSLEDFDNSFLSEKIIIKNLEIYSDKAVVDLYLNGCPMSLVENVKLGKNNLEYTTPVSAVIGNCWGTIIRDSLLLSKTQGVVLFGSTGGVTLKDNYISRAGGSNNTKDEIQVYKTLYEGSLGILADNCGIYMENNIVEHWYIPHSLSGEITINGVHIETDYAETLTCYLATGDATTINLIGNCRGFAGTVNGLGSILLKNFGSASIFKVNNFEIFQPIKKVIYRDNSTGTVELNGTFYEHGDYGGITDVSNLVVNDINAYTQTIYVSNLGDDNNWGIRENKPVKTLKKALSLATLFNSINIKILTDLEVTETIEIGNNIILKADVLKTINFQNSIVATTAKNIELYNIKLSSTRNPTMFIIYNDLKLKLNNSQLSTTQTFFNVQYSNLILTTDNASDVSVVGYKYAIGNGTFSAYIGTELRKKELDSAPTQNVDVVYFKAINLVDTIELDTPIYKNLMEQEGIYEDYANYRVAQIKYEKEQREQEQAKYEAYELLLQDNPNLTWEEFEQTYGNNVMMNLSLVERLEEPQIPESVKKFMEKYL